MTQGRLKLDAIEVGGCATLRAGGCPIAVFRPSPSELYAIENRCPHEGYPLSTGPVADGRLTCEWHNWKFELATGVCEIGGEDVRTFPIEVRDGEVLIDVSPLPPDVVIARGRSSLHTAFEDGDFAHAARAVERILEVAEPRDLFAIAALWGAEHAPYGFDHGLAAAADFAEDAHRRPEEADLRIVEAMRLIVEPNLRRPPRRKLEPSAGDEAAFREAVETEAVDLAEAMVLGACETDPRIAHQWLAHAATDHFLSYGHAHIYVAQSKRLLDRIGWSNAPAILGSLTARIVYGTREDRLPYMRAFTKRVAEPYGALESLFERSGRASIDIEKFGARVLDGDLDDAIDAVTSALNDGVAPTNVALALGVAASERLLRFDRRLDADDDAPEGWLDVTHALTHAEAVHATLLDAPSPELLRGLYHSARFINHMAPLDAAADDVEPLEPAALLDAAFDTSAILPIFVAHHVKTAYAAVRLHDALAADPASADRPLAAATRFVTSPLSESRTRRRVQVARRFVREGKMPVGRLGY